MKKLLLLSFMLLVNFMSFSQVTLTVKRLLNPHTGRHYYTTKPYKQGNEYNLYPIYEGEIATLMSFPTYKYSKPVYVVSKGADRILTISEAEKNYLIKIGYVFEGVMGYSATESPGLVILTGQVLRYFNGVEHFYTNNMFELGNGGHGYRSEGVAFYSYAQ